MKLFNVFVLLWAALTVSAAPPGGDPQTYRIWHGWQFLYYYETYLLDYDYSKGTTRTAADPDHGRLIAPGLDAKIPGRPANIREFMLYIFGGESNLSTRQLNNLNKLPETTTPDIDETAKIMYSGSKNTALTGLEEDMDKLMPGIKKIDDQNKRLMTMINRINKRTQVIKSQPGFGSNSEQNDRWNAAAKAVNDLAELRAQSMTRWFKDWVETDAGKKVLADTKSIPVYIKSSKGIPILENDEVLSIKGSTWGGVTGIDSEEGMKAMTTVMKAYETKENGDLSMKEYVHRKLATKFKKVAVDMNVGAGKCSG